MGLARKKIRAASDRSCRLLICSATLFAILLAFGTRDGSKGGGGGGGGGEEYHLRETNEE